MLQKAAADSEPTFPHLGSAFEDWYDSRNSFPSYYMDPFFTFPSMRKVGCYRVAEREGGGDHASVPESDAPRAPMQGIISPRCSNITDVDFQESNALGELRKWIQACKALKPFRLVHGRFMISGDDFQPRKIHGSLSLHKSTLEYIWVEPCQNDLHDGAGEWMGSFVDFTALKVTFSSLANLVELDELGSPVRKLQVVLRRWRPSMFLSRTTNLSI